MINQPQGANNGPLNVLFNGDDQMALKLRQKFRCKKALHWFMVHKAVGNFQQNKFICSPLERLPPRREELPDKLSSPNPRRHQRRLLVIPGLLHEGTSVVGVLHRQDVGSSQGPA